MPSSNFAVNAMAPRFTDFYSANRGGGLFSAAFSQRLGAALALLGARLGLSPAAISLTNLLVGLATSGTVVATAPAVAAGRIAAWAPGLLALVGWQLAYALDCADGQLARVTGQASRTGARLDILVDVAAQIALVTALGAVALAQRPSTPVWLVAAFAGCWMVNLVTSVLASGPQAQSLTSSTALPVQLVKLLRDYGAVIAVSGLVLTCVPGLTVWLIAIFTVTNGGFLLASIGAAARG